MEDVSANDQTEPLNVYFLKVLVDPSAIITTVEDIAHMVGLSAVIVNSEPTSTNCVPSQSYADKRQEVLAAGCRTTAILFRLNHEQPLHHGRGVKELKS